MVVLVIVFFPILFSVAATAAVVVFAFATFAFGIGCLTFGVYCAGKAATKPELAQRAAVIALVADLLLLPWMQKHGFNPIYIGMISFIVTAYEFAMLLIYKRRGLPSRNDKLSALFLALGGVLLALPYLFYGGILNFLTAKLGLVLMLAGLVLLLLQPPHSTVTKEENLGISIMAGVRAGRCVLSILLSLIPISIPYWSTILSGVTIVGLVIFMISRPLHPNTSKK